MSAKPIRYQAVVLLAVAALASGCTSEATRGPAMSERCRALVEEFDAAKARWQQARGTGREDELRGALNEVQDRLFHSGCLRS